MASGLVLHYAFELMRDEFVVTLDEADFVDAYQPARRLRRFRVLLLLLALIVTLLIIALLVRFPEARLALAQSRLVFALIGAILLAATLVLGLLVASPVLLRRAARSTLTSHPGMQDPVHYAFDPEQFTVRSTYAQANYPWGQLWDWRETERVLIVMPTPRNFYVLPKRGVDPAALDRLKGYLAQSRKRITAS
jgi:hypothetical protein